MKESLDKKKTPGVMLGRTPRGLILERIGDGILEEIFEGFRGAVFGKFL